MRSQSKNNPNGLREEGDYIIGYDSYDESDESSSIGVIWYEESGKINIQYLNELRNVKEKDFYNSIIEFMKLWKQK